MRTSYPDLSAPYGGHITDDASARRPAVPLNREQAHARRGSSWITPIWKRLCGREFVASLRKRIQRADERGATA